MTDGVLGANAWYADLGNGPAYEWVGWRVANPTISFDFGRNVTIDSVEIGFNRTEQSGIYIPPSVTIGGTPFTLAPDALTNGTRGFLMFNGDWTGSTLNIALFDNDPGKWIFVDEVKFDSPVPEASTTVSLGLLLCLGVSGLAWSARRRKAQTVK